MSLRALALACRDELREALAPAPWGLGADSVDLQIDGRPAADSGQTYVALHPGPWRGQSGDNDLDEALGVYVTITRRLGESPADSTGVAIWGDADGIDALARKIVAVLHKSYAAIRRANEEHLELTGFAAGGFVEPLLFQDGGAPQVRGPDWFGAVEEAEGGPWANAGLSQTITFGGARRVQGPIGETFT